MTSNLYVPLNFIFLYNTVPLDFFIGEKASLLDNDKWLMDSNVLSTYWIATNIYQAAYQNSF